ncbi:RNA polymerase, sigma-24 subunit, ECF subfamily [Methylobacterium sp. 4-46]|uniref:RNA polymerase sigma factor n=1 Tax=unclassified Methylobacterium TaxID=2615210 RepID=UPI000152E8B7|nr:MULTISPECIES: sigma-70 family RNA polymerase sigma factor [Methylobacterium]ACA18299.1 RNA polymerase, sigma-24 subunit, ECF subfamily [Methylobacterium sp. 4-46]WFT77598.1 sigma-70 family RNA polymerase sigma factor [Methylobacterium nodulans]
MASATEPSDEALLPRLRARDEAAFRLLVRRHHVRLVAVARGAGLPPEAAEEVVQESWIAAMRNLDGFEERSALRTWLTGIVVNLARKAARARRRTATFSDLAPADAEEDGFDADAFLADGHWRQPPWHWSEVDLERALAGRQVWAAVEAAIAALPPLQASVLRLRDVEGFGARETEGLLGLSEARQRVLLDRARWRVRATFERLTREAPLRSAS